MPAAVRVGCYEPGVAVLLLFVPFSSAGMGGGLGKTRHLFSCSTVEPHPPSDFYRADDGIRTHNTLILL